MKVTTIRILDKKPIFGQGTGKHQGCEVYPTTPTLLKRIKMSAPEQMILVSNQHKTLDKLPDYKSINNLQIPINNIFDNIQINLRDSNNNNYDFNGVLYIMLSLCCKI